MAKRILALLLPAAMFLTLAACGQTRIVHCDHCGNEIQLEAGSNIEEDWIVFCQTCDEELFGDNPVISPGN